MCLVNEISYYLDYIIDIIKKQCLTKSCIGTPLSKKKQEINKQLTL